MTQSAFLNAELILRAGTSTSRENADDNALTNNQDEAEHKQRQVVSTLESMGFEVLAATESTISIRAPKDAFEREFHIDASAAPPAESLMVPANLHDLVEGIYIQPPPTYFR